jgi:hypothetical protein
MKKSKTGMRLIYIFLVFVLVLFILSIIDSNSCVSMMCTGLSGAIMIFAVIPWIFLLEILSEIVTGNKMPPDWFSYLMPIISILLNCIVLYFIGWIIDKRKHRFNL